jgi:hypothetical protein
MANLENTRTRTKMAISQNEMDKLMFPNKIEEILSNIANIKARTSKVPLEKQQIAQAIENMKTSRHYQQLTQSQKIETGKILQESALVDQLLKYQNVRKGQLDIELSKIKTRFKEMGLSETVTSDILSDILNVFKIGAKKPTVIYK